MISKTSKLLTCNLWLVLYHQQLSNLPLGSSQSENLLPNNCLAAPCKYKGECRDRAGICGDTVAHCTKESLWVPGCGGGLGLDKPVEIEATAQSPPPPANRPTPQPVAMARAPPTASPLTTWEEWIGKKDHDGDDKDLPTGSTTGNESDVKNPAPNNEADWSGFDAEKWGYRGQEDSEDTGILDKGLDMIGLGDDEDGNGVAMRAPKKEVIYWSLVSAFLILS